MNRDESEANTANPKFEPFQLVKIRRDIEFKIAEVECPGEPRPPAYAMGMTGPIVMEGRHYVFGIIEGPKLTQCYSVQLENIGIVLVSEEWLSDGEPYK